MPADFGGVACPKPEPRARVTRRRQRTAAKVVRSVREQCVDRDGYCRIWNASPTLQFGGCAGDSQWAHLGESKRFKTRGKPAEERHTTAGTLMLCQRHHDMYDGRLHPRIAIEPQTDRGADGPMTYTSGRTQVCEVER